MEVKYYSRELWKSLTYNYQNRRCNLIRVREYLKTSDINYRNYKKRNRYKETETAKDYFTSYYWLEEDKVYYEEIFRNF